MLTGVFKFSTNIYFLNRLGVWVREPNNIPPPTHIFEGISPEIFSFGAPTEWYS